MTPHRYLQRRAVMDFRADKAALQSDFSQPGENIESGQCLGKLQHRPGILIRDLISYLNEELVFQLDNFFFRPQHLRLVLFECGCDVALSIGCGLLAMILRWNLDCTVRFTDLDVIAEDVVEAHFQALDSRLLTLRFLDLGDKAFAARAQEAQGVKLGVVAIFNQASFPQEHRRLRLDRVLKESRQILGGVGDDRPHRGQCPVFGSAAQRGSNIRQGLQRLLQCHQITRIGRARADPCHQPLQVRDPAQGIPQITTQQGVRRRFCDGGLTIVDLVQGQQRLIEPLSQKAAAERGHRTIENRDKALAFRPIRE